MEFRQLKNKTTNPQKNLEVFTCPENIIKIAFASNELTSLCPITGQPDFNQVEIEYAPKEHCLETKSLKLYLWHFRDKGMFAEMLAAAIAQDIYTAVQPQYCQVVIRQQTRGGITTEVVARC